MSAPVLVGREHALTRPPGESAPLWIGIGTVASVAVGWAIASEGSSATVVVALAAALGAVLVAAVTTVRGWILVTMVIGAGTVGLNSLRVESLATADLFLLLAAAGVAIYAFQHGVRTPALLERSTVGIFLIVVGGLLGTLYAEHSLTSLGLLASLVVGSYAVLALIAIWAPQPSEVRTVSGAFVLGAVVSALFALTSGDERPAGLAIHSNHLGLVCVLALGPALALAWWSKASLQRVAWIVAAGLLMAGIVISGSRAGVLGASVVLLLMFLHMRTSAARFAIVSTILVAICVLYLGLVDVPGQDALTRSLPGDASSQESDVGRNELLHRSLDRVAEHPLTGEGFESAGEAHNIYLQLWSSAGLLGLVGFVLLASGTLRVFFRRRKGSEPPRDAVIMIGLLASFAGFLVAGFVQNGLWDRYIWIVLGLAGGIAATSYPGETEPLGIGGDGQKSPQHR